MTVCPLVGFVREEGRDGWAACRRDCALYDRGSEECLVARALREVVK